ncbi:MAG: hypothetical protein P8X51_06305, partial [Maritimibacter sp.]
MMLPECGNLTGVLPAAHRVGARSDYFHFSRAILSHSGPIQSLGQSRSNWLIGKPHGAIKSETGIS